MAKKSKTKGKGKVKPVSIAGKFNKNAVSKNKTAFAKVMRQVHYIQSTKTHRRSSERTNYVLTPAQLNASIFDRIDKTSHQGDQIDELNLYTTIRKMRLRELATVDAMFSRIDAARNKVGIDFTGLKKRGKVWDETQIKRASLLFGSNSSYSQEIKQLSDDFIKTIYGLLHLMQKVEGEATPEDQVKFREAVEASFYGKELEPTYFKNGKQRNVYSNLSKTARTLSDMITGAEETESSLNDVEKNVLRSLIEKDKQVKRLSTTLTTLAKMMEKTGGYQDEEARFEAAVNFLKENEKDLKRLSSMFGFSNEATSIITILSSVTNAATKNGQNKKGYDKIQAVMLRPGGEVYRGVTLKDVTKVGAIKEIELKTKDVINHKNSMTDYKFVMRGYTEGEVKPQTTRANFTQKSSTRGEDYKNLTTLSGEKGKRISFTGGKTFKVGPSRATGSGKVANQASLGEMLEQLTFTGKAEFYNTLFYMTPDQRKKTLTEVGKPRTAIRNLMIMEGLMYFLGEKKSKVTDFNYLDEMVTKPEYYIGGKSIVVNGVPVKEVLGMSVLVENFLLTNNVSNKKRDKAIDEVEFTNLETQTAKIAAKAKELNGGKKTHRRIEISNHERRSNLQIKQLDEKMYSYRRAVDSMLFKYNFKFSM